MKRAGAKQELHDRRRASPLLLFSLVFAAAQLSGCDPVTVRTATTPGASFARYRTFSFGRPEDPPAGNTVSPWPEEVQKRVQPLIAGQLEQKGYTAVSAKGDLVLRFGSGRRVVHIQQAQVREGDQSLAEEPHFDYDVVEGSLVIDAFDSRSGARVWHASTSAEVDPNRVDGPILARSVAEALARLPRAGSAAP
jgi:hypothetical protein